MGIKELSLGRTDITDLDPRLLKVDPDFNLRDATPARLASLEHLKGMIKAEGVLVPLVIKRTAEGDGYVVVDGHGRLSCVMALIQEGHDIKSVPTRFEPKGTNDVDRILSMITLNSGEPFSPLEKAKVVKKAMGYGLTEAEIAAKIGITVSYINSVLMPLLESPQEILNQVKTGKVSAALAVQVQKDSPAEAASILQEAGEIAAATGASKTAPKHVAAAKEAREDAKAEPGQEPPPAKRPRVDWLKVGPKLARQVEQAITATDPIKGLEKLSKFYETAIGQN